MTESGGGFSQKFHSRPAYQEAAIDAWVKEAQQDRGSRDLPFDTLVNRSGKPDVAAQGAYFQIISFGMPGLFKGTSCSAPTLNGIVALLNEARLAAGKSSLGYMNPLIYKVLGPKGAFNDITSGRDDKGGPGYEALPGWDPASGFGTPNYGKMADLVMTLP